MKTPHSLQAREARLAWALAAPALAILATVAVFPLAATIWESLHRHDLRMPWIGQPFIGAQNFIDALRDPRLREALLHTVVFTGVSVTLEMILGLALALALDAARRARVIATLVVLLPWSIPTVVAALVWRFMFETDAGIVNALLPGPGRNWLADPTAAWVPLVLADVWKSTPFVALLLLAGLRGVDPSLYDAARLDGAGALRRFREITLPMIRPAILVALVFRTLDSFRVFDLVYVLTGGGPGTATEVVSLYAFTTLLRELRFGYGSALSVIVFAVTFAMALVYIKLLAPAREEA